MSPRTPITTKIIDDIRQKIEAGSLRPGDRLPSTSELAKQYGSSKMPVQTAIRVLAELGLVEGHQGRGVFVKTPASEEDQKGEESAR